VAAKSTSIVTALTVVALAAVGFLAFQASASAPDHLDEARKGGSSASQGPSDSAKDKEREKRETALPASSGDGERVVYGLGAKRVWLVGANSKVVRTYKVAPSSVSPAPGTYSVTSRTASVTGSDGVPIEHVVRFATVDNVVIGFSAAVDGSTPDPKSSKKTGGVREARDDGSAMWDFALRGTKVVVVA
jgi:hypothetical protein